MLFNLAMPASYQADYRWLARALLASFLLHLVLLLFIPISGHRKEKTPIEISLVTVPTKQKQQIVQPSEAPKAKPLEETKRLSDDDQRAMEEQIRRGLGGAPSNPSPTKKATKPLPKNKPKQIPAKKPKRVGSLRLTPDQLLATIPANQKKSKEPKLNESSDPKQMELPRDYSPFASVPLRNLFKGNAGTPDYLPEVKDGDLTLLNAKAYRYSVFVRRVATKVFSALQRKSWQTLPRSAVRQIQTAAVYQATLSKEGKLLKVELLTKSGSNQFDAILSSAVNEGAWDRNPPPGALAEDGTIRFIFQAKSWSRGAQQGQFEQRWILLGTGLL